MRTLDLIGLLALVASRPPGGRPAPRLSPRPRPRPPPFLRPTPGRSPQSNRQGWPSCSAAKLHLPVAAEFLHCMSLLVKNVWAAFAPLAPPEQVCNNPLNVANDFTLLQDSANVMTGPIWICVVTGSKSRCSPFIRTDCRLRSSACPPFATSWSPRSIIAVINSPTASPMAAWFAPLKRSSSALYSAGVSAVSPSGAKSTYR